MPSLLFWMSLAALAYVYVGYPALVAALGALRGRPVRRAPRTPRLSVIIAAYNEEAVIEERLDNVLASLYPHDRLEVLVASDGSTDGTEARVARYAGRGVRLLRLPRQGKIPALNAAVAQASGEVLVFTDANIRFDRGSLAALAANFADPEVGGVAGATRYGMPDGAESSSREEGVYWRYDSWLKAMESRTGSIVSAHGGLYAIRRELYRAPAESAVTDDFAISTAVVAQGRRLVYEPQAAAYETAIGSADREFGRKVRLMTRAWRSVWCQRRLLNPFRYGFYSLVLFSHKVLRRLLPLALLVLLASSLALAADSAFFRAAAAAQVVFYLLAAGGWLTRRTRLGRARPLSLPFYYCLANGAALIALGRFLAGERVALWQPQRHAAGA